VPAEGIIFPEESYSNIVPSLLPVLGVNPGSYSISILLASRAYTISQVHIAFLSYWLYEMISGITATHSSATFRVTFTGTASFALSFSQDITQVLGLLPHTT